MTDFDDAAIDLKQADCYNRTAFDMDKLKTILILVAVIIVALTVLFTIGFVYAALQYLLIIGIIGLVAVIVARRLMRPSAPPIEAHDHKRELGKAERTLEEYRRKLK